MNCIYEINYYKLLLIIVNKVTFFNILFYITFYFFLKFIVEMVKNQLKLINVHAAFNILFTTLILFHFSTTIIINLSLI